MRASWTAYPGNGSDSSKAPAFSAPKHLRRII
jgi:hypothetical protein